MKVTRNTLALVVLTAVALAGAIVLAALHDAVPDYLTLVIVAGVSAIAGVSVPDNSAATDLAVQLANLLHLSVPATPAPAPTPAAPVAPVAVSPLPPSSPATDQPPTA